MKNDEKEFIRGFSVCASFVCNQGGHVRLEEIFTHHGITLKMMKAAGVDNFDLKRIKDSMSEYEFKCIGGNKRTTK